MTGESEACSLCMGTGIASELEDCLCEGRGWVEDPSDGGTMMCPECDGDNACPLCDGEGFVDVEAGSDEHSRMGR